MKNDFLKKLDKACLKSAFTLAEVLITLAIIGIVAAMTIPQLISNTSNSENIKAWRKTYSEIASAWSQVVNDNGGNGGGIFTSTGDALTDSYGSLVVSKLKYMKRCTAASTPDSGANPCWHTTSKWYSLNKFSINANFGDLYTVILPNGGFFGLGVTNGNCAQNQQCFFFSADVNGKNGPNMYGKDIFFGSGWGNGKVLPHVVTRDPSNINDSYACREDSTINPGQVGQGCSRLALLCDEIDYTKGACKQK